MTDRDLLRRVARAVTPPLVWSALEAARRAARPAPPALDPPAGRPEWEYVPEGWARKVSGWDVPGVARAYRAKWPSFLEAVAGPGPLGINHEVEAGGPVRRDHVECQHELLIFGHALASAALGKDRVSVLDWGGGPGHFAVLARALFPGLGLEYTSRDLPGLVALGRELLPEHTFADDDSPLSRRHDLVVASESLDYAERWKETLAGLVGATGRHLLLTRTTVVAHPPSFVLLQRAHAYGYDTEYLGWVFDREELLGEVQALGLELVREYLLPSPPVAPPGAPGALLARGFLFARRDRRPG